MSEYFRVCEVCGVSFVSTRKDATACGNSCRSKRSKDKANGIEPRYRGATEAARQVMKTQPAKPTAELSEAVVEAVARELVPHVGPIVREHLTEKVMGSIAHMVDMVPDAIMALDRALRARNADGDHDHKIQMEAAKAIFSYTVGGALAPVPESADAPPLRVIFEGTAPPGWSDAAAVVDAEAHEVRSLSTGRSCESCGSCEADGVEFIAQSERCALCDDALRAEALAILDT